MQKNNFTATLPATRCTEDMRVDVDAVAKATGVDKADVIRDALAAFLPQAKLELQLVSLDDLSDEQLGALGVQRVEPAGRDAPPPGCWGRDAGTR